MHAGEDSKPASAAVLEGQGDGCCHTSVKAKEAAKSRGRGPVVVPNAWIGLTADFHEAAEGLSEELLQKRFGAECVARSVKLLAVARIDQRMRPNWR